MNYSNYRITLDVRKTVSNVQLTAKKGDAGRRIYITLSDKGKPCEIADGSYSVFAGVKPDGTLLYNKTTIENNTIIYEMTQQTTAVAGLVECEVKLFDSMSNLLTSPKLTILVDDVVVPDEEIVSKDEITAFAELVLDARAAIELGNQVNEEGRAATEAANAAAQSANDAATSANQATESANGAAGRAEAGAIQATQAAGAANTATTNANNAADNARTAAEETNTAREDLLQAAGDVLTSLSNATFASAVECTASGEVVAVSDASDQQLRGLTVYGKTTQNGTPSPENPVPLESAGDSGSIGVTVAGENLFGGDALADKLVEVAKATKDVAAGTVRFTSTNVNSKVLFTSLKQNAQYTVILYGINSITTSTRCNLSFYYADGSSEVLSFATAGTPSYCVRSSNPNKKLVCLTGYNNTGNTTLYYDKCGIFEGVLTEADFEPYNAQTLTIQTPNGLNGIGDVKDYKDFASGEHVQRFETAVYSSTRGWYSEPTYGGKYRFVIRAGLKPTATHRDIGAVLSSSLPAVSAQDTYTDKTGISVDAEGRAYVYHPDYQTLDAWAAYLSTNPITCVYELEAPIVSPIPAEELAQYAALHTNKPNTTVFNDAGAEMEVSYVADTKLYIDNKFTELQNAILATGANI